LDNDCDGNEDNGLTAPPTTDQDGVCAGAVQTCTGLTGWSDDYTLVTNYEATETLCDGFDNDCNGTPDENYIAGGSVTYDGGPYPGDPANYLGDTCGTGLCASGTVICGLDKLSLTCDSLDQVATEDCDTFDNDCDNIPDNVTNSPNSDNQQGVCAGATKDCSGGNWVEPNYAALTDYEASEVTLNDSKDNDCDGQTDEPPIPDGLILAWSGTLANVPAGWLICDGLNGTPDLRSRFVKGAGTGVEPGTTAGSASHDHGGGVSGNGTVTFTSVNPPLAATCGSSCSWHTAPQSHTHGSYVHSHTFSSASHDPPYFEVVFIMSQSAATVDGTVAAWSGTLATVPTGWLVCDGTNSTPDLTDTYLRGAADGVDAGQTGGNASHNHGGSNVHSLSAADTTVNTGQSFTASCGLGPGTHSSHGHSFDHSHSIHTSNNDPSYETVAFIQGSASTSLSSGIIVLWSGTLATIPSGWVLCDGNNGTPNLEGQFVRGSASSTDPGDTGGSATHGDFTASDGDGATSVNGGTNGPAGCSARSMSVHSHNGVAHDHSLPSSNHEPLHTEVVYIMKQ
jgi:hypothetical protein